MKQKKQSNFSGIFESFANHATQIAGSSYAFLTAVLIIVTWATTGSIFKYSDTWQLVINTGTTIITFLMVFLIQHSQNKDSLAIQLKLNELIASSGTASNRLIDVEDLSAEELDVLKKFYVKLSVMTKKDSDLHSTHSVDEAQSIHALKLGLNKRVKESSENPKQ